ncbi:hypothetical protein Bhyg_03652, partial [Pseudolycoriella hygida]
MNLSLTFLLICLCMYNAIADDGNVADERADTNQLLHDFLEKYNCLTYKHRPRKTCESVGGECISGCPIKIRHYDTTTCDC